MKVTLVGGMDRLEPHYRREAVQTGHELKIFFQNESRLGAKIGSTEAVVLFTGKISHAARLQAVEAARNRGIPLVQSHSSGVSSLRECLAALA